MPVKNCAVPGCSDKTSKRHRFPIFEPEVYQKWLDAVNNPRLNGLDPHQIYGHMVCHIHFKEEEKVFGTHRGLKRLAVPSEFLPAPLYREEKQTPHTSHFPNNLSKGFSLDDRPGCILGGEHNYAISRSQVKQNSQIEQQKKGFEEKQTAATYKPGIEHDYSIISKVFQGKHQPQVTQPKKIFVPENNNKRLEDSLPICIPNKIPELSSLHLDEQSISTYKEDAITQKGFKRVRQYRKNFNTIIITGLTITEVEDNETIPVDCDESKDTQQFQETNERNSPQLNNLICRLCKCECTEMTSLYSYDIFCGEQRQINEIIEKCAAVQISIDDDLPQFACLKCLEELHKVFKFRTLWEKTDAELRKDLEDKENTIEMVELEPKRKEPAAFIDIVEFLEADIGVSNKNTINDAKENVPLNPLLTDGKVNKGARRNNSVLFDINNPIIQEVVSSKNRKFIFAKLSGNAKRSIKSSKHCKSGAHILEKKDYSVAEKMLEYPQIGNINFNNSQFEMEDDDLELATIVKDLDTILHDQETEENETRVMPFISEGTTKKNINETPNLTLSTNVYTCELCNNVYIYQIELMDHLKTHMDTSCELCKNDYNIDHLKLTNHLKTHMDTSESSPSILYCELTKGIDKDLQAGKNPTNSNLHEVCEDQSEVCQHKSELIANNSQNFIESRLKPFLNFNKNIYKCSTCKKKFKNKILYLEHNANVHNMKVYKCVECNKKFAQLEHLRNHKKMKHESRIKTDIDPVQQEINKKEVRYKRCYVNRSKQKNLC